MNRFTIQLLGTDYEMYLHKGSILCDNDVALSVINQNIEDDFDSGYHADRDNDLVIFLSDIGAVWDKKPNFKLKKPPKGDNVIF